MTPARSRRRRRMLVPIQNKAATYSTRRMYRLALCALACCLGAAVLCHRIGLKEEEANAVNFASTLERTELKAKIGGVVTSRNVEAGEIAETGKSLLTIVDPSDVEATLLVSGKDIAAINEATQVEIRSRKGGVDAWVKRVSPKADDGSGLYPVVVGIGAGGLLALLAIPAAYKLYWRARSAFQARRQSQRLQPMLNSFDASR